MSAPAAVVRVRVDDDGCRLLELESVVLVLAEALERCESADVAGDPLTPARELLAGLRRLRELELPESAPVPRLALAELEARLRARTE